MFLFSIVLGIMFFLIFSVSHVFVPRLCAGNLCVPNVIDTARCAACLGACRGPETPSGGNVAVLNVLTILRNKTTIPSLF